MASLVNLVKDSLQPSQRWPCVKQSGSLHYTKIGDACVPRHVCPTPSMSPSWTLDQPGTVKVGSGPRPTLRDGRHDEQRGSPNDAKCNVAEIGAVNMGDIGAVRKRSR